MCHARTSQNIQKIQLPKHNLPKSELGSNPKRNKKRLFGFHWVSLFSVSRKSPIACNQKCLSHTLGQIPARKKGSASHNINQGDAALCGMWRLVHTVVSWVHDELKTTRFLPVFAAGPLKKNSQYFQSNKGPLAFWQPHSMKCSTRTSIAWSWANPNKKRAKNSVSEGLESSRGLHPRFGVLARDVGGHKWLNAGKVRFVGGHRSM